MVQLLPVIHVPNLIIGYTQRNRVEEEGGGKKDYAGNREQSSIDALRHGIRSRGNREAVEYMTAVTFGRVLLFLPNLFGLALYPLSGFKATVSFASLSNEDSYIMSPPERLMYF